MKRWNGKGMAGLLVGVWLAALGSVRAGPYVDVMQPCDCPPTQYSALHVLTPVFYRWAAWCQGPSRYTFAKVLHPETPTTQSFVKYHCPSINPLQFSLANYPGLRGNPPSSQHTSPQARQSPRPNPSPELPSPKEEKFKSAEKLPPPKEEPDNK